MEELLINSNINLNQLDIKGRTPIFYLFTNVEKDFIEEESDPIEQLNDILLNDNIELNVKDYLGNTLLHYCAVIGSFLCTTVLVKKGVDINAINLYGNTAFNYSLIHDKEKISLLLL